MVFVSDAVLNWNDWELQCTRLLRPPKLCGSTSVSFSITVSKLQLHLLITFKLVFGNECAGQCEVFGGAREGPRPINEKRGLDPRHRFIYRRQCG